MIPEQKCPFITGRYTSVMESILNFSTNTARGYLERAVSRVLAPDIGISRIQITITP